MSAEKTYVRLDEHGVMRVGNSRVMLDSIVAAFEQGHSPETIRQQYPALSLEEVYGSIAYCLAHADEVNAYLRRQEAAWESGRTLAGKQTMPVLDRLRALRGGAVSEAS